MIKSNSILNLMISHHGLLEALLTVFNDNLGINAERTAEDLDDFKWELEKHIFTEEKVMFKFCKQEGSETCELVNKLEQEHIAMLKTLDGLKDNLPVKNEKDIAEFQKFMINHRETEEKDIYPKLDQELSEATKEEIIARINEISIKK